MNAVGRPRRSALSVAALMFALSAVADSSADAPSFVRTTANCVLLRRSIPESLDERQFTSCTNTGYGWEVLSTQTWKSGRWYLVKNIVTSDVGWLASWYTEPVEIKGVPLAQPTPAAVPATENEAARLALETAQIQNETARYERDTAKEHRKANQETQTWIIRAALAGIVAAIMTAIAYALAALAEVLKRKNREDAPKVQKESSEPSSTIVAFPTEEWRTAREARHARRRDAPSLYHGTSADGNWSIPVEKAEGHEH